MGTKRKVLLLLLVVMMMCYTVLGMVSSGGYEGDRGGGGRRGEEEREEEEEEGKQDLFLLQDVKHVVKTDAGDMKVVRGGFGGGKRVLEKALHVGFITMEPKSLFIPQYLDSNLILFIHRGEAKVGSIHKDELVEKQLKSGDVYRIGAGSAFYLVNIGEGQRLHIICSIDKTDSSFGWGTFQSFFIGGGRNPISIIAGFDPLTLSTALNVSVPEVKDILTRQRSGPIIHLADTQPQGVWTQFMQQKPHERLQHLKRMVQFHEEATKEESEESEEEEEDWSVRLGKLLYHSVFGNEPNGEEDNKRKASDSYNLYDRKPDFKNRYGWSLALDHSDYSPLRHSDVGLYLVNLTAGSMLAPHVNPTATEYGIVLRGSGTVQVVFPNGTLAMNAKVSEGDVFLVPRYFPFCQIASRSGPFEFFGFTTSSRKNRPQFLAGANSILHTMKGPEFAAAFGVSEERLHKILDAQRETVILPSASAASPDKVTEEEVEVVVKTGRMQRVIRSFGDGF
ncbi:hypothetical protein U1Q18_033129 [Sarracenia purpurea var. burkii]